MATTFDGPIAARQDHKFFFVMSWIMAATIFAGFAFNLATGRSSFAVPLVYHVHAAVFFSWVALYLTQNSLIFTGSIALHRRLGWIAVIWVPLMMVMGTVMTVVSLRRAGGPPFFDQNEFLFSNPTQLLVFAGLTYSAVAMRKRTDWHRRLMFCGMALLTSPGLGRLLPMPFLIPYAWWIAIAVPAVFPIIGMIADKRRTGSAHPAWFIGIAAVVCMQVVADTMAYSSFGKSITQQVIADTPGADRSMTAFFPS